jgi:hypothetical protein
LSSFEILSRQKVGKLPFPEAQWKSVSTEAKDLVNGLLMMDAKVRLNASDVKQHPWIIEHEEHGRLARRDSALLTPSVLQVGAFGGVDHLEIGLAMANRKRRGTKGHLNSMLDRLQSVGRQASICEIGTIEERPETPEDALNSSAGVWGDSFGSGVGVGGSAAAAAGAGVSTAEGGEVKKRKKTVSLGSLQGNSLVQRRQKKKLSSGSSDGDGGVAMPVTPSTAPTVVFTSDFYPEAD